MGLQDFAFCSKALQKTSTVRTRPGNQMHITSIKIIILELKLQLDTDRTKSDLVSPRDVTVTLTV